MRVRPQSDWLWTDAPDLRIIPQELWDRVQARRQRRRHGPGTNAGRKPKYLFSGLLWCGECGSHYTIKDRGYYACSANVNRGSAICPNGKLARRDRVEHVLLDCIFADVFSPDAVAYLTHQVNDALARMSATPDDRRQRLEADLRDARGELEDVLMAIRQGLVTPATRNFCSSNAKPARSSVRRR